MQGNQRAIGLYIMIIRKITPNMIVYGVIATDSVAARGLVNGS